jgi:hypothetical protein
LVDEFEDSGLDRLFCPAIVHAKVGPSDARVQIIGNIDQDAFPG